MISWRSCNDVGATLQALVLRADGRISTAEDEAKVQVQTGDTTLEQLGDLLSEVLTGIYPIVLGANKLMHQVDQIDDAIKLLIAKPDRATFTTSEAQAKRAFQATNLIMRKLAGRLRDAEGQVQLASIQQGLRALEAASLGADGVFASQREALDARTEFTSRTEELARIERGYFGILADLKRAVEGVNQEAGRRAATAAAQAVTLITASVALTLLAGLSCAFLFSHRISAPLIRLAAHVADIRHSGELIPLSATSVTGRTDEIGALARAFNLMIAELSDARQRLIAWSGSGESAPSTSV